MAGDRENAAGRAPGAPGPVGRAGTLPVRSPAAMRRLLRLLPLLLASCGSGGADPRPTPSPSYFPLHMGDEWTYSVSGTPAGPSVRVVVTGTFVDAPTGIAWSWLADYNGAVHGVRENALGQIHEWNAGLWYRFGASYGVSWTMDNDASQGGEPCSDGATLAILRRDEVVTVPAGTFSALHITFQQSCADGGITDEWFAPGVGLVKRTTTSIAGPRVWELEWALIEGLRVGP